MKIKEELLGKEITLPQRTIMLSNNLRPSQIKLLQELRPDVFEVENATEVTTPVDMEETSMKKSKKKVKEVSEDGEEEIL
jgi:hypothetical protein